MIPQRYIEQTVEVIGGTSILGRRVSTQLDLIAAVDNGIPATALSTFLSRLGTDAMGDSSSFLSAQFEHESILGEPASVLTTDAGRSLVWVAFLYVSLSGRFESDGQLAKFLVTEHPELNYTMPFVRAMTESGAKAVEEIVARGEHGLPV